MPTTTPATKKHVQAAGMALALWLMGFGLMESPLGDPLLRLGYDCWHLFIGHKPDPKIMVIAINAATDRKLGLRQGDTLSRTDHARLLNRLRLAGVERVCYDIIFDRPAPDPAADEAFRSAIAAHGHVILGAEEEEVSDGTSRRKSVIAPVPVLRAAAEGWGLLNIAAQDGDGVVRRFNLRGEQALPLALVAAKAETAELEDTLVAGRWLRYQTLPGDLPTVEFADCLDPEVVPDAMLRGKTVFIGGQYPSDSHGRQDVLRTPYSRFGTPVIFGVAWHATVFLNARDGLWLTTAGRFPNALWSLPFAALLGWLMFHPRRPVVAIGACAGLAVGLTAAAIFSIWNDRVLGNWMVPLLVQCPFCLLVPGLRLLVAQRGRGDSRFSALPLGERRLVAVVFTDVVSYSARMQRDEAGTLALVRKDFAIIGEAGARHGGEVLNTMGDGMLLCFPSAVQAVACALHFQAEFARRKATASAPADVLEHRAGIHLGDAFRQEAGGIAGDGVNIAARLQARAPLGGICISQTVYDTVKGKVAMQATYLGPETFKNITEPVPIYHIVPGPSTTPTRPSLPDRTE